MAWQEMLDNHIRDQADQSALEWLRPEGQFDHAINYGQLDEAVNCAAGRLLALGVRPGDRVALWLSKSPAFLYYHLAALKVGAISLPLNPEYSADELGYYVEDAAAAVLVIDDSTGEVAKSLYETRSDPTLLHVGRLVEEMTPTLPPVAIDPPMTALMIYTSGTTGRPKGAEITHGNLTTQLAALKEAWGWSANDRLLHVLPFFHVHGLIVALHAALHAGATTVVLPRFAPQVTLDAIAARRCTVLMGVPTLHRRLVECPGARAADVISLRLVTSGSDRLPDDLFDAFRATFDHTLLERYGMTEAGMLLSNPLQGERRRGSVGRPLPGVAARIADPDTDEPLPDGQVGEVQVRGANVFKGYWRQPEKTAAAFTADGWFRTGDLGLREPDGYFTLKGRASDLIITGGYNVYPAEVERVLLAHPAVAACAVFGCPDDTWGEQVAAAVVPAAGVEANAAELPAHLLAHCRAHLAPYKVPRRLTFTADLPRNALGKVRKDVLRRHCPLPHSGIH